MNKLIRIFCEIDNYCKEYELSFRKFLIDDNLKNVIPKSSMALSEIMTINKMVIFSQFRFIIDIICVSNGLVYKIDIKSIYLSPLGIVYLNSSR